LAFDELKTNAITVVIITIVSCAELRKKRVNVFVLNLEKQAI